MSTILPELLTSVCLVAGCAADFIFGDPKNPPNPVRLFGAVICRADDTLNTDAHAAAKGALFSVLFVAVVFICFSLLEAAASSAGVVVHTAFHTLFVFFGLAGKSLITGCGEVFSTLNGGDEARARSLLSKLVGRDTANLNSSQIKTAALETMSENLSDGVVAPVFFYLLGGVPAMMAYKAVNTLDSMIGYKTPRHLRFGMTAARMDDVANFVPARLTALFMALCSASPYRARRALVFTFKFGRSHPSPNAGFPQAALAGILDCRLGGPSFYGGRVMDKPYMGLRDREPVYADYIRAKAVNQAVAVLAVALAALVSLTF